MPNLPTITVDFREKAENVVARSAKGVLCIVANETSMTSANVATYTSAAQIPENRYSTANTKAIKAAFFAASPRKVIVIAKKTWPLSSELDKLVFDWIVIADFSTGFTSEAISGYVARHNSDPANARKVNTVVSHTTSPGEGSEDHCVVMANQTFSTDSGSILSDVNRFIVAIASILCACPITESVTYKAVPGVNSVEEAIGAAGNYLYLTNDDGVVRIVRGIFYSGDKIAVTAAKDLIREDVIRTFKDYYLGKKRNSAENQGLFCSAILGYLKDLAAQSVINPDDEITVEADVDAMREAWEADGVDVSGLTDAQVRAKPYKSTVFVKARCTILDAIEDLTFVVELG